MPFICFRDSGNATYKRVWKFILNKKQLFYISERTRKKFQITAVTKHYVKHSHKCNQTLREPSRRSHLFAEGRVENSMFTEPICQPSRAPEHPTKLNIFSENIRPATQHNTTQQKLQNQKLHQNGVLKPPSYSYAVPQ